MELNFRDKKIRKDDGMDFTKLSLKELREMAKEKGLSGISALRKAELIEELKKAEILSQSVVLMIISLVIVVITVGGYITPSVIS